MKENKKRWLGIDGEGLGRSPHRYVMLCDSDGDSVEDVNSLSTHDVFTWLHSRPVDTRLCGFYLSYDITMWFADLPDKRIYQLFRPELRTLPGGGFSWIRWKGWKIHYLRGALYLSRNGKTVTVWDHGPYHQSSFVVACEKAGFGAELGMITEMKAERGTWHEQDLDRMREYCVQECRLMVSLANQLEASLETIKIHPRVWFGPGNTAGLALKAKGIAELRGDLPWSVVDAAEKAYFGGRFEHSCIGRRQNVWGYDITSAYPAQMAKLPCLVHGRWRKSKHAPGKDDIALVRLRVSDIGDCPWSPLPCRIEHGRVVFARGGFTGWYWNSEVQAALQYWEGIDILHCWVLERRCNCAPFGWVADMYAARHATHSPLEKQAYKLVLNSCYGKLAQRVGNPKFASAVWAGLVTSGTRAELLHMLARHKNWENVYAMATDGIYSSESLLCPDSPTLGQWGKKDYGAMWFARSGIYWAENDSVLRARGVGRKKLGEVCDVLSRAIAKGEAYADLGTQTAFGGAKETVYAVGNGRVKRSQYYGEWHEQPCRLTLKPGPKRDANWQPFMLPGVESLSYGEVKNQSQMLAFAERLAEYML